MSRSKSWTVAGMTGALIVTAGFMSGGTFVGQPATTSLMVAIDSGARAEGDKPPGRVSY
jgi:hypothetical protein